MNPLSEPESQNLTGESPKPAEGLSRRFVLAGVASATILPPPLLLSQDIDPVFAVIERGKLLSASYSEAVNHPHVGVFPKCSARRLDPVPYSPIWSKLTTLQLRNWAIF